ncbi:hypothetical protein B0H14DRAFT_2608082 [Mycena olivaceomarginata]|nr:hypothetical protein B0H14DRAFT_2608082 [Mycena olivaceomarginata]
MHPLAPRLHPVHLRPAPARNRPVIKVEVLGVRQLLDVASAPAIVPLPLGDAGHELRSAVVHEIRCREGVRPAQSHIPLLHHDYCSCPRATGWGWRKRRILGRDWIGVGGGSGENEKGELLSDPPILDSSTEAITGSLDPARYYKTVTRPASPDLLYGFEVVHREDGADDESVAIQTRITVPLAAASYLGYILTLLPPELSLHILNLLLFPSGSSSPLPQQQQQAPSPTPTAAVPSTPVPLTLEQQHITAVEGIVPTLQKIVAIVNSDCSLDLKTIARNAEYNPSSGLTPALRLQLCWPH